MMSESESESDGESESEVRTMADSLSEEESSAADPSGIMSFQEAREHCKALLLLTKENTICTRSRTGRPKTVVRANRNVNWKFVTEAFKRESGQRGLCLEDLELIRKLLVQNNIRYGISFFHKATLVFYMIPQRQKIPGNFIKHLASWVFSSLRKKKCDGKKILVNLLPYFVGVVEYELVDGSPFKEPFYYNGILSFLQSDVSIPMACRLLKLSTEVVHVTKTIVSELLCFRSFLLSPNDDRAVTDLLRLYRAIAPNLFPKNILKVHAIGRNVHVKLDASFEKKLYDAQGRITGRPSQEVFIPSPSKRTCSLLMNTTTQKSPDEIAHYAENSLNNLFFPEFSPMDKFNSIGHRGSSKLEPRDRMFFYLRNSENLAGLVLDPLARNHFYYWVARVFEHKFQLFHQKDSLKHNFILDNCIFLTNAQEYLSNSPASKALPPVDAWLPDFMLNWNFDLFFPKIMKLFTSLSVMNFAESGYMGILKIFEQNFIFGSLPDRKKIWEALETLFVRWWYTVLETDEENEDQHKENVSMIKILYEFMCKLINVYCLRNGIGDNVMLSTFCETFENFAEMFMGTYERAPFWITPPSSLWYMILASDSLKLLNDFSSIFEVYRTRNHNSKLPGFPMTKSLINQVAGFYGTTVPLEYYLYHFEKTSLISSLREENGNRNKDEISMKLDDLNDFIGYFNIYTCPWFEEYRMLPRNGKGHRRQSTSSHNVVEFDIDRLKSMAPAVAANISRHTHMNQGG